MSFPRRLYLLVLLALVAIPRFSYAGADWAPIDPAELQMKSLPEQPGAPACVLFREEIDDDLQHTHSLYMRIKVFNEAGRKYADVQIPYFTYKHTTLGISDVQGRTIHSDGSIVVFQGKPYDQTVIKSKTVKVHRKVVSLPDVQVGSVLEFRYVERYDSNIVFPPRWEIQEEMFVRKEHFRFITTSVPVLSAHGDARFGVAYTWKLPKGVTVKDDRGTFDLQLTDVPAFAEEEHMPPAAAMKYSVRFYYGQGGDPEKYWKEEAKYWRQDVEHFMSKKRGVADAAAKLTAPSDTPDQKAKKIYAYVGGLDNSTYKPRRSEKELKALDVKEQGVEDILRQQGGNQQELTLLFVAMARAAGLSANAMWVANRSGEIFEKNYLSTDQLDAYLAIISLDNKEVYLDPGTKFCPFGLLYWPHSNSGGLKETASGAEVSHTPGPGICGRSHKASRKAQNGRDWHSFRSHRGRFLWSRGTCPSNRELRRAMTWGVPRCWKTK